MTEEELKLRLRDFALRVLRVCDALPGSAKGRAIAGQLVRSGTSPGTNYRAACRGRSPADFVAKLAIAEEEMDESNYWLDLIMADGILPASRLLALFRESDELTRILCASRLTATRNSRANVQQIKNQKSKIKTPVDP